MDTQREWIIDVLADVSKAVNRLLDEGATDVDVIVQESCEHQRERTRQDAEQQAEGLRRELAALGADVLSMKVTPTSVNVITPFDDEDEDEAVAADV